MGKDCEKHEGTDSSRRACGGLSCVSPGFFASFFSGTTGTVSKRTLTMAGLLAILILGGLANVAHVHWLTRSLTEAAQSTLQEERKTYAGMENTQFASEVAVWKEPVLIGKPAGKLTLYVCTTPEGQKPQTSLIEYLYKREKGEWILTESGRCSGGSCAVRAREAFGLTLDDNTSN